MISEFSFVTYFLSFHPILIKFAPKYTWRQALLSQVQSLPVLPFPLIKDHKSGKIIPDLHRRWGKISSFMPSILCVTTLKSAITDAIKAISRLDPLGHSMDLLTVRKDEFLENPPCIYEKTAFRYYMSNIHIMFCIVLDFHSFWQLIWYI